MSFTDDGGRNPRLSLLLTMSRVYRRSTISPAREYAHAREAGNSTKLRNDPGVAFVEQDQIKKFQLCGSAFTLVNERSKFVSQ